MLRHSCATRLINAGVPVHAVQRALGHSHLATPSVYLHVSDDVLADQLRGALSQTTEEDTLHRQRIWAAFTGGAAGIGTGGFLPPLVQFIQRVRFERMNPDNALVLAGTAWALAERGNAYVFYLPYGGTVKVDLHDATGVGTFTAEWYDPRTGAASAAGVAAGGTTPSFTAPAAGDWTLYLHR